jgi:hypothetical protein
MFLRKIINERRDYTVHKSGRSDELENTQIIYNIVPKLTIKLNRSN